MRKHVQYNLKTYDSISESYDLFENLNKEKKMSPTLNNKSFDLYLQKYLKTRSWSTANVSAVKNRYNLIPYQSKTISREIGAKIRKVKFWW